MSSEVTLGYSVEVSSCLRNGIAHKVKIITLRLFIEDIEREAKAKATLEATLGLAWGRICKVASEVGLS